MRLSIPFHSVVDLITNSSTVVYTWAAEGAVGAVKDIINEVLQKAGSEKTADDLYEVSVSIADGSIDQFIDRILDLEDGEIGDPRFVELRGLYDNPNWQERWAKQRQFVRQNFSALEIEEELEDSWGETIVETVIVVESLDGTDSKIDAFLPQLFSSTANYNG